MCPKLVNLGSLCIDFVYSVPNIAREGETVSSLGQQQFPGGKGLNQSVSAALAGITVHHHGSIGADGALLREALEGAGVIVDNVLVSESDSGRAFIQVDASGSNAIVIDGGANRSITPGQVKAALDAMGPADWLLLQNEINDLDEVIRQGADRGLKIALNLAPVDQRIKNYPLDMLDLLIVNLVEGQAVSGTSDTGVALAEKIADLLPATSVLLTEGKNGSIMIDCENRLRIETGSFDVEVVDETAAGDAFVGYFMAGLVESRELGLLLKEASAAGAVAVSRPGAATSIPQRTDVEAMLHAQSVSQEIRTL